MANKQTIKPKVVPFEIAKLLKEVGYDEKIAEFWAYASPWTAKGGIRKGGKYNEHYGSYIAYSNSEWEKSNIEFSAALKLNSKHPAISAPSYDMVLDWLLEHFGYYICVANISKDKFCWQTTSWCVEEGLCHTRLYVELECVYKDITNKIVEKKGKLTNEDVIEFQKKLQEVYDTNAAIREKVTGIKDSKNCILTKEACEELIKRLNVINIKENE